MELFQFMLFLGEDVLIVIMLQVRICKEKTTGNVYAMKKLKKSEMLRRGQVYVLSHLLWTDAN